MEVPTQVSVLLQITITHTHTHTHTYIYAAPSRATSSSTFRHEANQFGGCHPRAPVLLFPLRYGFRSHGN